VVIPAWPVENMRGIVTNTDHVALFLGEPPTARMQITWNNNRIGTVQPVEDYMEDRETWIEHVPQAKKPKSARKTGRKKQ